nr:MAG TPA: hypothetical protein [Caudoviricetes sp.]
MPIYGSRRQMSSLMTKLSVRSYYLYSEMDKTSRCSIHSILRSLLSTH